MKTPTVNQAKPRKKKSQEDARHQELPDRRLEHRISVRTGGREKERAFLCLRKRPILREF